MKSGQLFGRSLGSLVVFGRDINRKVMIGYDIGYYMIVIVMVIAMVTMICHDMI